MWNMSVKIWQRFCEPTRIDLIRVRIEQYSKRESERERVAMGGGAGVVCLGLSLGPPPHHLARPSLYGPCPNQLGGVEFR
jgi:hypothetical protein